MSTTSLSARLAESTGTHFGTGDGDESGSLGRFVQSTPGGPYAMEVVIETPEAGRLTYAWWWAAAGEQPVEQSKADVRLHADRPTG